MKTTKVINTMKRTERTEKGQEAGTRLKIDTGLGNRRAPLVAGAEVQHELEGRTKSSWGRATKAEVSSPGSPSWEKEQKGELTRNKGPALMLLSGWPPTQLKGVMFGEVQGPPDWNTCSWFQFHV
jgi:hypothetical protein